MSTTTSRLGLYKTASDGSEYVNVVTDLLNNWDAIDLAVGSRIVTSTTRPSTPYGGQHILESDTSYRTLVHNGTAPASGGWIEIPNGSATYGSQISASRAVDSFTFKAANTFGGGNTNASILTEHAAATAISYASRVAADSFDRLRIRADGRIDIGPGTGARDTNLYRSAADTLKTDDSFVVGASLNAVGAATLNSTLAVTGATTLGSTLAVTGTATVGGDLTVTGIGQRQFGRATSDQSITNSTALVDATGFTFTVVSGGVYVVRGLLGGSGSTTGDLKIGWTAPGSSTFDWTPTMQPNSASATVGSVISDRSTLAQSQQLGTIGAGTTLTALINGLLVAGGAGTFKLQIAQGTADAGTASALKAGSYLVVERVA